MRQYTYSLCKLCANVILSCTSEPVEKNLSPSWVSVELRPNGSPEDTAVMIVTTTCGCRKDNKQTDHVQNSLHQDIGCRLEQKETLTQLTVDQNALTPVYLCNACGKHSTGPHHCHSTELAVNQYLIGYPPFTKALGLSIPFLPDYEVAEQLDRMYSQIPVFKWHCNKDESQGLCLYKLQQQHREE